MKKSEIIKEIRLEAKKVGLTFVTQNATINGSQAYKFIERGNKFNTLMSNCTLSSAYENVCSGYIASFNGSSFTMTAEDNRD